MSEEWQITLKRNYMVNKMNDVRLLRADEIECRVGMVKKDNTGCSLLLYKDARVDMRILDETVGSGNWQRSHRVIGDNLYCKVSIWSQEMGMWISKEDVGVESKTEKEKGQASDAFKRACFNWNIGRELYTAPFIWIRYTDAEQKGAFVKFAVRDIEYDSKRNISYLLITDNNGNARYEFGKKRQMQSTIDFGKEVTI
jgi:hypothetical protein